MTYSLVVDIYEPSEIASILSSMINVNKLYLVDMDLGDYHWVGADGKRHVIERKTANESIADSGGGLTTNSDGIFSMITWMKLLCLLKVKLLRKEENQ